MPRIHPSADVQCKNISESTRIWQFVVVLPGATIGKECNICSHCFIENDVVIGDRVTIKAGVQLWDGLRIGNDVFIGPNVSFTNDRFPRSRQFQSKVAETIIGNSVSIGAGSTILPDLTLGAHAMIGAGAVVTRSVPSNAIVVGNPARIVGYVGTQTGSSKFETPAAPNSVNETNVKGVYIYQFPLISDIRGSLSVGEFERTIPFAVKRYFMVFDVPSIETRGEHAHKVCHQFLICVKGRVSVVADDGTCREEVVLDRPNIGIHLPPMTWGIQYKYSADALLLVFASDFYDADDYIRDYSEFLNLTRA